MGITRIGVQPVVAAVDQGSGKQTYVVGELEGGTETVSVAVGCVNDLTVPGNLNVIHWQGAGTGYRIYKAEGGAFGLIGEVSASPFLDANLTPDLSQPPPS